MPTSHSLRALLALALFFFVVVARAQTSTGVIEGRVFNAATGSALANARVTVEGTGREAVTDGSGEFRFTGVPVGPTQLNVNYLGMASQKATVNVSAGGAARQE